MNDAITEALTRRILNPNPPDTSDNGETFLTDQLILLFSILSTEEKFSMFEIFTNQAFKKILDGRIAAVQDRIVNLNLEGVPLTAKQFHFKFMTLRVELGLLHDIKEFLMQALESVKSDHPEAFVQAPELVVEQ